jgi:hypothetical protein
MRECKITRIDHAALECSEERLDIRPLVAEASDEGAANVQRQARLTPSLHGQAANEAEAPGPRLEETLELDGTVEERFTSALAMKESLEVDESRPRLAIGRQRRHGTDRQQGIGSRERSRRRHRRELVASDSRQRHPGGTPLGDPSLVEHHSGAHELLSSASGLW